MGKLIECHICHQKVENEFSDPYDTAANISIYHSPRCDHEYCFKCPRCGNIEIFTSDPTENQL